MVKKTFLPKKTSLPKPPRRTKMVKDDVVGVEKLDVSIEGGGSGVVAEVSAGVFSEVDTQRIDGKNPYLRMNHDSNQEIRAVFDENFMEYARYVIKDRAIPDVDDGLKPVQRRILWSLYRMDDGKFHKVQNAMGHTMQFHPHGDRSIGDALVLLANRDVYIEKQGNFGSVITGDENSAFRYIEARLSPLAKEVLFNSDITDFVDSYDGRNKEPIRLPAKIPSLLILGAGGMAVGMSTLIPPHNFCEAIKAQIKILKNEAFVLYPDYPQGGLMDVSEYDRGVGRLRVRAKIERDGRRLVIRELPANITTEKLMASIEMKAKQNKIKIQEYQDYTGEDVEIEIIPSRGMDPDKLIDALYAYTECEYTITPNILVICDSRPVVMGVDQILLRNTEKLLTYLSRELQIKLIRLGEKYLARTLERIFIEERIYKKIEQCKSREEVYTAVYTGLKPFASEFNRAVNDDDVERLLAIPIRRISLFDIAKNRDEMHALMREISETLELLKKLKQYAINYLKSILTKYGHMFPRRTEITTIAKANAKAAALSNIKVGWDRKGCYIGSNIKSEETVTCTEFDRLLCVERDGGFKIVRIPEKLFVDKLYDFRKYDSSAGFCVIYTEKSTGKVYWKRFQINKVMTDKDYKLCPAKCRIELFTVRLNAVYTITMGDKKQNEVTLNLWEAPERSAKSRGLLIGAPFESIKFIECVNDIEVSFGNPEVEENVEDEVDETSFQLDEEDNVDMGSEGWTFHETQLLNMQHIVDEAKSMAENYRFKSNLETIEDDIKNPSGDNNENNDGGASSPPLENVVSIEKKTDEKKEVFSIKTESKEEIKHPVTEPEIVDSAEKIESEIVEKEVPLKEIHHAPTLDITPKIKVQEFDQGTQGMVHPKEKEPPLNTNETSQDDKNDWGMIQMELGF